MSETKMSYFYEYEDGTSLKYVPSLCSPTPADIYHGDLSKKKN